jgi:uncharacterized protein (TIGR00106 family)
MSVILDFSMFPIGKEESLSTYVAKIIKILDKSNITYKLNPMGTSIETEDLREALDIIYESYKSLENDVNRIYSVIKLDIRKNRKIGSMDHKIKSVKDKVYENNN